MSYGIPQRKMFYVVYVIPDKRSAIRDPSVQSKEIRRFTEKPQLWIPAFAGMTSKIKTYNLLSLISMGQIPWGSEQDIIAGK